jgi:predicted P-loop ATPase
VARIYQPGCKADQALILEGKQRAKKSSVFEALCPNPAWYTGSIAELGTKDSAQDLPGKWLVEMPELSAMKRGDVERIKSFITCKVDHYRPSYGKRSRDFPRQSVLGGTTNSTEYLRDTTGGRRFWGVLVLLINLERLRQDRDQLWAEAVHAYKAGEQWWLSDEQEKLAEVEQEQRRERHPWEDIILSRIEGQTSTSVRDLLNYLGLRYENMDQKHANTVVAVLTKAGWWQKQVRTGHHRARLYYPPPKTVKKRKIKPRKA